MKKQVLVILLSFFAFFSNSFAERVYINYVDRDIDQLEKFLYVEAVKLLKPILIINDRKDIAHCLCAGSPFIIEAAKYVTEEYPEVGNIVPDIEERGCPTYKLSNDIMTPGEMDFMLRAGLTKTIESFFSYRNFSVQDFTTCDGVYDNGTSSLVKQGERIQFQGLTNSGQVTIIRNNEGDKYYHITRIKTQSTYILNVKTPSAEATAVYDTKGLNITNLRLPYDWKSSTEVQKLDENIAKNMDKLPLYLSAAYNQVLHNHFCFKTGKNPDKLYLYPIDYLKMILTFPYDKGTMLMINAGYKLVELKESPDKVEKELKNFCLYYD